MLQRLRRDEAGMSLVEAVVALALFALVSGTLATILISSVQRARASQMRVVAAHLAGRELEAVREEGGRKEINKLLQGGVTTTERVGSIDYRVRRSASWTTDAATADSCTTAAGSAALAYLRVAVEVSWPNMADARPARAQTLLTPKLDPAASATGAIAVRVSDRDGNGAPDHLVSVVGPGGSFQQATTDAGCAHFGFLAPGDYSLTLSTPGYVDRNGHQTVTDAATVMAGAETATSKSFVYDRATTLILRARDSDLGFPLVTSAVTLASPNYPGGVMSVPASGPRATVPLFPWREGVQVWSGDCRAADPRVSERSAPITLPPGASTDGVADGRRLRVSVTGSSIVGRTVLATPRSCPGLRLTLGTSDGSGTVQATLPYGVYDVAVAEGSGTAVTLSAPDTAPTTSPVSVSVVAPPVTP